ncbi:MAG: hypothetical protein Q9196_005846 [Gyalolechia fulgens]
MSQAAVVHQKLLGHSASSSSAKPPTGGTPPPSHRGPMENVVPESPSAGQDVVPATGEPIEASVTDVDEGENATGENHLGGAASVEENMRWQHGPGAAAAETDPSPFAAHQTTSGKAGETVVGEEVKSTVHCGERDSSPRLEQKLAGRESESVTHEMGMTQADTTRKHFRASCLPEEDDDEEDSHGDVDAAHFLAQRLQELAESAVGWLLEEVLEQPESQTLEQRFQQELTEMGLNYHEPEAQTHMRTYIERAMKLAYKRLDQMIRLDRRDERDINDDEEIPREELKEARGRLEEKMREKGWWKEEDPQRDTVAEHEESKEHTQEEASCAANTIILTENQQFFFESVKQTPQRFMALPRFWFLKLLHEKLPQFPQRMKLSALGLDSMDTSIEEVSKKDVEQAVEDLYNEIQEAKTRGGYHDSDDGEDGVRHLSAGDLDQARTGFEEIMRQENLFEMQPDERFPFPIPTLLLIHAHNFFEFVKHKYCEAEQYPDSLQESLRTESSALLSNKDIRATTKEELEKAYDEIKDEVIENVLRERGLCEIEETRDSYTRQATHEEDTESEENDEEEEEEEDEDEEEEEDDSNSGDNKGKGKSKHRESNKGSAAHAVTLTDGDLVSECSAKENFRAGCV